jgi:hypothetical protein
VTDYLGRLAARALGVGEVARPRRPLFEPRFGVAEPMGVERSAAQAPPSAEDAGEAPAVREALSPQPAPKPAREAVVQPARADAAPPEPSSSAEAERSEQPPAEPAQTARPVQPPKTRARPERTPAVPAEPAPAAPRAPCATQPPLLLPAPPPRLQARSAEAEAPAVKVTIGRVEVRAVTPEPAREPKRRRPPVPKRMSLDEYLSQPRGRGR